MRGADCRFGVGAARRYWEIRQRCLAEIPTRDRLEGHWRLRIETGLCPWRVDPGRRRPRDSAPYAVRRSVPERNAMHSSVSRRVCGRDPGKLPSFEDAGVGIVLEGEEQMSPSDVVVVLVARAWMPAVPRELVICGR
jgi:hypothetical protein